MDVLLEEELRAHRFRGRDRQREALAPNRDTFPLRTARRVLAACASLRGIVPEDAWFDRDPRTGGEVLRVVHMTDRTWTVKTGRRTIDTGIPVRRVLEFRPGAGSHHWRLVRTLVLVPLELLPPIE